MDSEARQRTWRKSSRSGNTNCVEVAITAQEVLIRDSKDCGGAVLKIPPEEWAAFLHDVKHGTIFTGTHPSTA